jgi:hypothetical protein
MAFLLVVGRFTLRVGIITVMSSYHARLVRERDVFAQSNIWHLRFRLGKNIRKTKYRVWTVTRPTRFTRRHYWRPRRTLAEMHPCVGTSWERARDGTEVGSVRNAECDAKTVGTVRNADCDAQTVGSVVNSYMHGAPLAKGATAAIEHCERWKAILIDYIPHKPPIPYTFVVTYDLGIFAFAVSEVTVRGWQHARIVFC